MTTEEEAGRRPSGSTALGIPVVDSGDHWSGVVGNAALFSRAFRIYYAWGIGEHWTGVRIGTCVKLAGL
jgi:hypothetical protein